MRRESAREIDVAAAAWAARVDRGLSESEAARLEAWLAGDVRRQGAYAKARAVALRTVRARALGPAYDPDQFAAQDPGRLSRRGLMLGAGGAMAAGIGVTAAVLQFRGRIATGRGEVRVVPLADGSIATLNTASKIYVSYSADRRGIRLIQGEVLFDVAKDPTRPFVVTAGDTQVRALGTSFTVRRLAEAPVQVLVREGVVEVARRGADRASVRLNANTRAVAVARSGRQAIAAAPVSEAEVGRELAWREGRIAFEGETLEAAAAQFARYSETRILIDDPQLRQEEITGLFQANDPVGFAEAAASALNAQVQIGAGEIRLARRPSA